MLLPNFSITQEQCDELIFTDTTPDYSGSDPNGYGGYNVSADAIVKAKITLNFGRGQTVELSTNYKRSDGEWLIRAYDLPYQTPEKTTSECGSCGGFSYPTSREGYLRTFPDGCITVIYEVFSSDSNAPDGLKSEGVKVTDIVLSCHAETEFADVVFKKVIPGKERIVNPVSDNKKAREMDNIILLWQKLKLVNLDGGCNCECIASRVEEIHNLLKSLK